MKLTRRGFLAGAGAVAAGSAAWGLDPNRAWADEEVAEEPAGTDEAPAEEPAAPAGPVVVCEECPGACTLVLEVEDGRVAAVRGDGANPFSEGRLCLRAQALTDLWKAPKGRPRTAPVAMVAMARAATTPRAKARRRPVRGA